MSDYIEKYKKRLSRNGNNTGEVYANNTIAFVNSVFHESPTFHVLEVQSTEFPHINEIDARVADVERMGSLREVTFRPQQYLNIGTYVKFDNRTWIISDMWGDTTFSSKALVQRCNQKLRFAIYEDWKDENGLVDKGSIFEVYCVASQSPLGSKATQGKPEIGFNRYDVMLPDGQLFVYVERNRMTSAVRLNQRFIFNNNVYEVYGIDDTSLTNENGYGIIQLTVRLTTKRDEDDFENQIAYNGFKSEVEEEGSVTNVRSTLEVEEDEDNGGMIW